MFAAVWKPLCCTHGRVAWMAKTKSQDVFHVYMPLLKMYFVLFFSITCNRVTQWHYGTTLDKFTIEVTFRNWSKLVDRTFKVPLQSNQCGNYNYHCTSLWSLELRNRMEACETIILVFKPLETRCEVWTKGIPCSLSWQHHVTEKRDSGGVEWRV